MQKVTDKPFLKKLGRHLKNLRQKKGMTQLELAVSMDNYAEQISRIERGELNVTICTLKKIADALELPLQELFDFT